MDVLSTRFRRLAGPAIGSLIFAAATALVTPAFGEAQQGVDFANQSIEELMNVDVTSVSRKQQKLSRVPAAIYVITQDEIARSGATTIPDLLQMAPGVQVAQVDANRWAISIRGFNDIYSNKLLVLVDGRTVYTPSFSGVYWDQIDVPLDTIERIEVIRGSGGSVWGANAVNGVINIITKSALDTKGARISAGGGITQSGDYQAQYGGALGGNAAYRAFGHYSSFNPLTIGGVRGNDGWSIGSGGFRLDWKTTKNDSVMVQGDVFRMNGDQNSLTSLPTGGLGFLAGTTTDRGLNIFTEWKHRFSDHSETTLHFYDNHYDRTDVGVHEQLGTADFDFQHHVQIGSRNDVVWGLGTRLIQDHFGTEPGTLESQGFAVALQPASKNYALFSSFFQDEIALTHSLSLTVGTKLEHNAFTGFENEPSVRAAWLLSDAQTLWASASRSIREPSRLDTGLDILFRPIQAGPVLVTATLEGNKHFLSETANDYEAGYRVQPFARLSLDLASFYGKYENLQSDKLSSPNFQFYGGVPLIEFPFQLANSLQGRSFGGEISADWNASSRWKLIASYSLLETAIKESGAVQPLPGIPPALAGLFAQPGNSFLPLLQYLKAFAPNGGNVDDGSPRNQAGLRSYLYLTDAVSFDTSYYYVGALPGRGISAYNRVDARLGWKLNRNFQFSVVGQNLLQPRHMEFGTVDQVVGTEAERNVFARLTWSF